MEFRGSLGLVEKNASITDTVTGSDVGGKGTFFLSDDELVFGKSRTGKIEGFFGDTLDNVLYGLPSRLGLYDPFSVTRAEADRYDDTMYISWDDIEGVCPLKHGGGSSVFVETAGLKAGQRYQFLLEPKSEHSGIISSGTHGTHTEFAEELLQRSDSAELIDIQSDITGSTSLLDVSQ